MDLEVPAVSTSHSTNTPTEPPPTEDSNNNNYNQWLASAKALSPKKSIEPVKTSTPDTLGIAAAPWDATISSSASESIQATPTIMDHTENEVTQQRVAADPPASSFAASNPNPQDPTVTPDNSRPSTPTPSSAMSSTSHTSTAAGFDLHLPPDLSGQISPLHESESVTGVVLEQLLALQAKMPHVPLESILNGVIPAPREEDEEEEGDKKKSRKSKKKKKKASSHSVSYTHLTLPTKA